MRGFTLIEAMISAAMVGLLGAGALSLVHNIDDMAGRNRRRTQAVADAQQVIDRTFTLAGAAASHGGLPRLCEALQAPGAPMSTAGGGTVTGACPALTATGIAVPGTPLKHDVTLASIAVGESTATEMTIVVHGNAGDADVVLKSVLPL